MKPRSAHSALQYGGEIVSQHVSDHLDLAGHVRIKPDLVWRSEGRIRAVFDAKYKIAKSDAYPNADVYQMLAYCIRHNVPEGHLIYAEGDDIPQEIDVRREGSDEAVVRVHGHAVDLSRPPPYEAQVGAIVDRAIASARSDGLAPARWTADRIVR